jgi:hypothetical protein
MGRRGDPLNRRGIYFYSLAAEVRKSSGYRSFTTYPSLFEPFLPVLASTIAKYPKSIQWKNLGNTIATRINFMVGQLVSVAIDHTDRNYSPHRPEWPEAMNQLSIFLFCIRC